MPAPEHPNPLFDSLSDYSLFRGPMAPGEKLRGYFLELAARVREGAQRPAVTEVMPVGPAPPRGWELTRAGMKLPLAYTRAQPIIDAGTGRRLAGKLEIALGRSEFGRNLCTFFVEELVWTGEEADCRLFVIDRDIEKGLVRAVGGQGADIKKLEAAFSPLRIAADRTLARLLSAVPDLDGRITASGTLEVEPVVLPEVCQSVLSLPGDVTPVLVINTRDRS